MNLFPARPLLIDRPREGQGRLLVWHRPPLVTLVSARDKAVVDPAELRALGYRRICHETIIPGAYYARPWALWALLKAANAIRDTCWRTVWRLYGHGIFHLTGVEGTDFRWRDVRPGPDRRFRLTKEEIEKEMTRIQTEVVARHLNVGLSLTPGADGKPRRPVGEVQIDEVGPDE